MRKGLGVMARNGETSKHLCKPCRTSYRVKTSNDLLNEEALKTARLAYHCNVSKSGVSTSIGTRGAWFTVGPRGNARDDRSTGNRTQLHDGVEARRTCRRIVHARRAAVHRVSGFRVGTFRQLADFGRCTSGTSDSGSPNTPNSSVQSERSARRGKQPITERRDVK
jgi:hypothetical protein